MLETGLLDANGDPDFMTSLARGLVVLRCFAQERKPMTIAQASRLTGLSRPAVKRCLHTFTRLGYAVQNGQLFSLQPKVLSLGYAYLSSSPLATRAQPLLDRLRDELHESCSLGVIEEDQVCYIARAEMSRIMSIALRAGSRLPLYCTSMGRILLAAQPEDLQRAYLARTDLVQRTGKTIVDPDALIALFKIVAQDGHVIVDQELEVGLRSIAVPVMGRRGVIAAVNLGTQANSVGFAELKSRFLPALQRVAAELGSMALD